MTNNNHPITPPPELVQQWFDDAKASPAGQWVTDVATQAAQWGFNQHVALNEAELQKARDEELEECCKALDDIWDQEDVVTLNDFLRGLRSARRPKPLSLKEQALEALDRMDRFPTAKDQSIIRRALESLPD